jgi:hypothetical protein
LAKNEAKLRRWTLDMGPQLLIQKSVMSVARKGRSFQSVPSTVRAMSMPKFPDVGLVNGPSP